MREILFRGKKTGFDEWIEGCITSPCKDTMCSMLEKDTKTEWFVDAETVGQYTGSTDKNGNKIFEGDVLKYTPLPRKSIVYEVIWQEERSRFALKTVGNGINLYEWLEKDKANCCCEIIGNIHDNPELLKGGAE